MARMPRSHHERQANVDRYANNLRDELDGSALYAALAAAELDPVRKELFEQLARAEAEHAETWRAKLAAAGVHTETFVPSFRTRVLAAIAKRFGPRFVLPAIASAEFADRNKYANQVDAQHLAADEHSHAELLQAVVLDSPAAKRRGLTGAQIARTEPWHRGSGNELRAAVLGANDGLVSNLSLVMGVAGAGSESRMILLTGIAGLIAGAVSMALGEWLSVTNARELARSQIERERQELEETPDAERKELALIFQAKGFEREEAQRIAAELMQNKDNALDTLAREELGIDPAQMGGNPWSAAAFSFVLFSVGAAFPLTPFFFVAGTAGIWWSLAASLAALAAIGVVTSLFSGRGPLYSAVRQMLIGAAAAGVTYVLGTLVGASLG